MDFIIVNGEILKKAEIKSIPFFLDDPLVISKKMWFGFGGIPLFDINLKAIIDEIQSLNTDIPKLLLNKYELYRITKRMLNKNKFYRSGIISFQVLLGQTKNNLVISSFAFPEFDFPISKTGLILNFSEFEKYRGNPLNQYSYSNLQYWKFAEARNRDTSFHNSIILNDRENVCECISANIFMRKGKTLHTPGIETGCYLDSTRALLLKIASKTGFIVDESTNIKKEDIFQMNEIFLASEEKGIQWVLGVGNKRFVHRASVKMHELLNLQLKKMVR
jgi:branched-subunit amino acid aminotransferase/4-amino-4-deoxychorismate lyase